MDSPIHESDYQLQLELENLKIKLINFGMKRAMCLFVKKLKLKSNEKSKVVNRLDADLLKIIVLGDCKCKCEILEFQFNLK